MSQVTDDRFAPDGWIWVCCACGKTAKDRHGVHGENDPGWDESCASHAELLEEAALVRGGSGRVIEIIGPTAERP